MSDSSPLSVAIAQKTGFRDRLRNSFVECLRMVGCSSLTAVLILVGCSNELESDPKPEIGQPPTASQEKASSDQIQPTVSTESDTKTDPIQEPVPSPELEALAHRLDEVTAEVEKSPRWNPYAIRTGAHYQLDPDSPTAVREVVMNVVADGCDDGCVYDPTFTPINDEDLLLLVPFARDLKSLDVQFTAITDVGLGTISKLSQLESLNLNLTKISGGGLARLASLEKLQHLDLGNTALTADDLRVIAQFPSLQTLQLSPDMKDDACLVILSKLPQKSSLDLAKAPVTDAGLVGLTQFKFLETLDLSDTEISDAGLVRLAELTNLKELRLSRTKITNAGLAHLSKLTNLQILDLTETKVGDEGLAHLSSLQELTSLKVKGTSVLGFGLKHLKDCNRLREAWLSHSTAAAFEGVNSVKSWYHISEQVQRGNPPQAEDPAMISLDSMPEFKTISLRLFGPLEKIAIDDCPKMKTLKLENLSGDLPGPTLVLTDLPGLESITLSGAFCDLQGTSLPQLSTMELKGEFPSSLVRGLSQCHQLKILDIAATKVTGLPVPDHELPALPNLRRLYINVNSNEAAWLVQLISKTPGLEELYLNCPGLTAKDLAPLTQCSKLKSLRLLGIDDDGAPLAFLNSHPALETCEVSNSPAVGRVTLTSDSNVQSLSIGSQHVESVIVEGADELLDLRLGRSSGMQVIGINVQRIVVRDVPQLHYLMVDAYRSKPPLSELTIANVPRLKSLLIRGTTDDQQSINCRALIEGEFQHLVSRRLFNLSLDQAALDRLNASPVLKGGEVVNVRIDSEMPQ